MTLCAASNRSSQKGRHRRQTLTLDCRVARHAALAACLAAAASPATAKDPLTTRCESAPIAALFKVFGDTGRMPPDLGRFLQSAALQKIEPYKAFDNVYYVGICWVSAWLITSPRGHVLIDALYGPYTAPMLDNIRSLGFDPKDIRQVVITQVDERPVMRAVAPVVDASLQLIGRVVISTPLDGEVADAVKAALGAEVLVVARGGQIWASFRDALGDRVSELPLAKVTRPSRISAMTAS